MPSASELRAELKEMRKSHPEHMPVSKMKKSDVSDLIQRMKLRLEETPPVAAVKSAPSKVYKSAVESVKTARASEFPTEIHSHAEPPLGKHSKKAPATGTKPKKNVVPEAKKAEAKAHAEIKKGRPAKGSEDARAHMAKIRGLKGKKPADE